MNKYQLIDDIESRLAQAWERDEISTSMFENLDAQVQYLKVAPQERVQSLADAIVVKVSKVLDKH
jgi:hypothetical protein